MKPYVPAQKAFARDLRSHQTDAEQQLWHRLRRKQLHGLQFYRQKPIGPYIVDFYCAAARLVIELDGSQHFEPAHQSRDQHRDAFLAQQGLLVLRFDNLQALKETDAVIQVVLRTLETRIPPAPLLQRGVQTSAATSSITTTPSAAASPAASPASVPPPFAKGGPGGICSGDPYLTEAQNTPPRPPPGGPAMSAALLENFDLLAASVGGVARLRELILSLALRGRLVPQDPNDEPASELLKQIRAQKDRLIKEGKIKRGKHLPPLIEDDKPYDLPASWEWVRLGDLLPEFQNGASSRGDEGGTSTVVLRLADIKNGQISLAAPRTIPINGGDVSKYSLIGGDILIVRVNGSADIVGQFIPVEFGVSAIYCDHFIRMRISQDWCRTGYLCLLGKTSLIRDRISRLFITTAGQKTVNQGHIGSLLVALPPLAEQFRIVAKVEELMALCDRLEAEQGRAAWVRGHWVDAALDQLAESADADEFRRHWQHLAAHFDTLFTTPESIDRLDATLLQLAVRGKLVPQDPNDEPASELLKQIRAEKDRLIKEGKIKRSKPLPEIAEDERHYELPAGWEWVRLADLVTVLNGRAYKQHELLEAGTPVLRVGNLFTSSHWYYSDLKLEDDKYCKEGDLLFAWSASFGPFIWSGPKAIYHYHIWKLDLHSPADLNKQYIYNFPQERTQELKAGGHGVSMVHMTKDSMEKTATPLPPLAEQSRIVAQVEKLQSLTASLKVRLTAAQTKQSHLAEALIAEFV